MATLTTKYSVGDVVYCANTTTTKKSHPCPDCKGERKWRAVSPAGSEYEFACPRCSTSYNSDRDLMLDYQAFTPYVTRLTIGSIQVNTAKDGWDHGTRYMCVETGVGSGTIYDEAKLFETQEDATEAAQAIADGQNVSVDWVVKQYDKTLRICDYQIENAALKLASETKSAARSMLWNLDDLFNRIENECADKDSILEAVEEYRNYDWERDQDGAGIVTEDRLSLRDTFISEKGLWHEFASTKLPKPEAA